VQTCEAAGDGRGSCDGQPSFPITHSTQRTYTTTLIEMSSDELQLPMHSPPSDGGFVPAATAADDYVPPVVAQPDVEATDDAAESGTSPHAAAAHGSPSTTNDPPSEFDIVTGDTPMGRLSNICTDRRKLAAVGGAVVMAAVVALVLILAGGDSSAKAGDVAFLPVPVQNRQHASREVEEYHASKVIDTASFATTAASSTYACMYECAAGEPKDYDPSTVHTVGGCQATPCSAFGEDYCGIWGGQASESFQLESPELCARYVEKMTPVPVHQRAAAFHVTVSARLNRVVESSATSRRALTADPAGQLSFGDLRAGLSAPDAQEASSTISVTPTEVHMCEQMVGWAADKIHLQQREAHSANFVCDANTICPHFDGAHAKQCRTVEKALNLHLPRHPSFCSYIKEKIMNTEDEAAAIPQVMCTQLLGQVDKWLEEELHHDVADAVEVVHEVEDVLNGTGTTDDGVLFLADKAEQLACHKLLPTCEECCHVIGEVLDKTINPWLIEEGHTLIVSVEHAAARFWHWLCDKIHQL
jgi:hypothetical protein